MTRSDNQGELTEEKKKNWTSSRYSKVSSSFDDRTAEGKSSERLVATIMTTTLRQKKVQTPLCWQYLNSKNYKNKIRLLFEHALYFPILQEPEVK